MLQCSWLEMDLEIASTMEEDLGSLGAGLRDMGLAWYKSLTLKSVVGHSLAPFDDISTQMKLHLMV